MSIITLIVLLLELCYAELLNLIDHTHGLGTRTMGYILHETVSMSVTHGL